MKILLAFVLIVPFVSQGQCTNVKEVIDDFTEERSLNSDLQTITNMANGLMSYSVLKKDEIVYLMIASNEDRTVCLSQNESKAQIKFSDKEIISLPYVGDVACNSAIVGSYTVSYENLLKLSTKEIEMIRISYTEFPSDYIIETKLKGYAPFGKSRINPRQHIKNTFNCINN